MYQGGYNDILDSIDVVRDTRIHQLQGCNRMSQTIFVIRAVACAVIVAVNFFDRLDNSISILLALQELNAAWMVIEWISSVWGDHKGDVVSEVVIPGIATMLTFMKNASFLLLVVATSGCVHSIQIRGGGQPISCNAEAMIIAAKW